MDVKNIRAECSSERLKKENGCFKMLKESEFLWKKVKICEVVFIVGGGGNNQISRKQAHVEEVLRYTLSKLSSYSLYKADC